MYYTGWGIQVEISKLTMAALVWRDALRPFRLCQYRHRKRLQSGEDRVNLASLPVELLQMVESQLFILHSAMYNMEKPFLYPCECEDFAESPALQTALEDHMEAIDADWDDSLAMTSFWETDEYDVLFDEWMSFHLESGDCKAFNEEMEAWQDLVWDTVEGSNAEVRIVNHLPEADIIFCCCPLDELMDFCLTHEDIVVQHWHGDFPVPGRLSPISPVGSV